MRDPNEIVPMHQLEPPVSYGLGELLQHNIEAGARQNHTTVPEKLCRGVFKAVITGFEAVANAPYPRAEDAEATLVSEGFRTTQPSPALVADRAFVMRKTWWRQVRAGLTKPFQEAGASLHSTHPAVSNSVWIESGGREQLVEFEQAKPKAGWLQRLVERVPSPFGPEDRG